VLKAGPSRSKRAETVAQERFSEPIPVDDDPDRVVTPRQFERPPGVLIRPADHDQRLDPRHLPHRRVEGLHLLGHSEHRNTARPAPGLGQSEATGCVPRADLGASVDAYEQRGACGVGAPSPMATCSSHSFSADRENRRPRSDSDPAIMDGSRINRVRFDGGLQVP
jgi:hypothetical protein